MTVTTGTNTPATRAELEEAMRHLVGTLKKMPKHWIDRRALIHARIDAYLYDWEQAA